jgi:tRNA threonylcarbamoyladenosine biosynthesis protein TsaE
MRTIIAADEGATRSLAREIAAGLRPGMLVALSGELGTGKTALVRGICEYFECLEQVSSPTFTIINEYTGSAAIAHCDLYRLDSVDDLFETGIADILQGEAIVLIEWAERGFALLPYPRLEILCDYGEDENERVFTVADVAQAGASLLVPHHSPETAS